MGPEGEKRKHAQPAEEKHAYRVEPHHPDDPDGEGEVDHQDDDEQEDKQVEAALPPAVDADLVDVIGHRPGRAAALGGGDILLPHHLLAATWRPRRPQRQMLKGRNVGLSSRSAWTGSDSNYEYITY